ncbi:putative transcription factor bHLH family [Lupinus albus]|uniref:Putative transcription factor bHLH family n=1 Tax=Lupinus albus TaxID=3870 RepID=A0A6A4R5E7_LUPAL|nr:putative transcription factor bHLH family [Lupinus albus]
MSQCVPSWDVDDNNPPPPRLSLRSNSNSTATDVPMLDYEVAELTWENGQPSMHGLGLPRLPGKPSVATTNTASREFDLGFTSTSMGSPENTSSAKQCTKTTVDDHDSVCHSRPMREDGDEEEKNKGIGKSSVCTKRSRAAAIHNQSERKRRDKINQRMKTLQKLVPNSSKSDKASMLDEVIEYLKQLQAQLQMMNRINMSSMMLPMAMQQQLQMSMMAGPMGMGMGMGMGMNIPGIDMNTMNRSNIPGIPPLLHPSAFMSMPSWDGGGSGGGDRVQGPPAPVMPDPSMFPFFGCQAQPMNMDAYSRIAAMYQQMHQPPPSGSKN